MNTKGSPIQLCQQGQGYSSMGSQNDTDITEVTIKEKKIVIRCDMTDC